MNVEVLLFAAAREKVGAESVVISLPEAATVADLRAALKRAYPALAPWAERWMIALDQQYASDRDRILPAMEIACIPPVSGG